MNEQEVCPEGRKDDRGKNRLDLIPPEVILALGQVMTYGAGKYGANNWQGGGDRPLLCRTAAARNGLAQRRGARSGKRYAAPVACAHKCGVYGISGGEK